MIEVLKQSLVGKWHCTSRAVDGKTTSSWPMQARLVGRTWLKLYDNAADAATQSPTAYEINIGYDTKRHQWVWVELIGDGYYMLQVSRAPIDSTTQSYIETYPVYPGDGPEIVVLAKDRLDFRRPAS